MQNKENTSLSHFGRLRRKADRITAAAILSSTFNINAGCESDPAPKEDNTSELESKLAKVKEEAKQKEDTLKGQISTLEEAKATLEGEKTTLEGEKTTKTTAINNLIGFVNALGGKTENPLPAGMAGLHSKTAIAENDCSLAHTVANSSLKTIYDELRLLNTNTAGQELSTLKSAIELFYQKNDIIASYTSTSGNVQALSAPTSGSTSATTVGGLLTHIEGLIASLKAEKTDAETAKTEYSAALSAIEGKLNITPATGTKVDQRATDCNTKITALENIYTKVVSEFNGDGGNSAIQLSPATDEASCKTAVIARLKTQAGTPYTTVVGALNAAATGSGGLGCAITTIGTTEADYKNALDAYVGNLKAVYDLVPESGSALTPKEKKEAYLTALKAELNKIIDLYKATTDTTKSNVDLTDTSLILFNTIVKLVDNVTVLKPLFEYLYNNILGVTDGNAKTLDVIVAAIRTEGGSGNRQIEDLKGLGWSLLDNLKTYAKDPTLLHDSSSNDYTRDNITMSELNNRLTEVLGADGPLSKALWYQLSENLLSLTKKLTQAEAGEVSTALTASWHLGTAAPSDEKTSRENLLTNFVASRTPIAGPAFLADNHQTVLDFIASFNKCNSTDKLTFVKSVIDKIKGDAVA